MSFVWAIGWFSKTQLLVSKWYRWPASALYPTSIIINMSFPFVALTFNEANDIATHLKSVAWPDDEVGHGKNVAGENPAREFCQIY